MIYSRQELTVKAEEWHSQSKIIVFTNGCFDLLHQGHIDLLTRAETFGDILIVGINSDDSVNKLKGQGRPVEPQNVRVQNLVSHESVSGVCIFEEETPQTREDI